MACGSCPHHRQVEHRQVEQRPIIEQKPKIVIVDRKKVADKKIAPKINKKIKLL
jgi:hypothetical protein